MKVQTVDHIYAIILGGIIGIMLGALLATSMNTKDILDLVETHVEESCD